jgi:hypothetical protein
VNEEKAVMKAVKGFGSVIEMKLVRDQKRFVSWNYKEADVQERIHSVSPMSSLAVTFTTQQINSKKLPQDLKINEKRIMPVVKGKKAVITQRMKMKP